MKLVNFPRKGKVIDCAKLSVISRDRRYYMKIVVFTLTKQERNCSF